MSKRIGLFGLVAALLVFALSLGVAHAAARTAAETTIATTPTPANLQVATPVRILGEIIEVGLDTSPRTISFRQLQPVPAPPVLPRADAAPTASSAPQTRDAKPLRVLNVADDAIVTIDGVRSRLGQLQSGWLAVMVVGQGRTVIRITANPSAPPTPPVRPVPPPVEPQPVTMQGWLVRLPGEASGVTGGFGLVVAAAPPAPLSRAAAEDPRGQPKLDNAAIESWPAVPAVSVRGIIKLTTADRLVYQAMERYLGLMVSVTGTWKPDVTPPWGRTLQVSEITLAEWPLAPQSLPVPPQVRVREPKIR
jgi:hypothetical protein